MTIKLQYVVLYVQYIAILSLHVGCFIGVARGECKSAEHPSLGRRTTLFSFRA